MTERQLIDRLNDLGYARARRRSNKPGEFRSSDGAVVDHAARAASSRADRARRRSRSRAPAMPHAARAPPPPRRPITSMRLELGDRPTRAADARRAAAERRSLRRAREAAAGRAVARFRRAWSQAVLAIEDRRFYDHPGIDPIGMAGAVFSYLHRATQPHRRRPARSPSSSSATSSCRSSTAWTLQTARERRSRRKVLEIWVSLVLTRAPRRTRSSRCI